MDFNLSMNVVDNSKKILENMERQAELALEVVGSVAEGNAKDYCPVDTGRLRNSITHEAGKDEVVIGSNVEYAPAVEYRDMAHKTGRAHFMRDAVQNHQKEYEDLMAAIISSI